jgi:hypothetical protein
MSANAEYLRERRRRMQPRDYDRWREGRRLKAAFEPVKLRSQSEVARIIGVTQARLQQLEREIWWKIAVRMRDPGFMPQKYRGSEL